MTLWILGYDDCSGDIRAPIYYVPFYAVSREEGEQKAQRWLAKQLYPVRQVSLQEYPDGFQIWHSVLPGKMHKPS